MGEILSFRYGYHGSIGGGSYSYDIDARDGNAVLTAEFMEYGDYGEMTSKLDADVMERLSALLKEFKVRKWDGFNESDPYVCDGNGFSLRIGFSDGGKTEAYGTNSYPTGYYNFKKELDAILKPTVERMFDDARKKKIAKGVSGELLYAIIVFSGRGKNYGGKYEFILKKNPIRNDNFSVKVTSCGEKFFPEGTLSFYTVVPENELKLGEIADLIKKYDVVKWMDHDVLSSDKDSEWFQISFSFEKGSINATGSEHPANYDAFRNDLLTLLADVTKNAIKHIKE